ncbi:hypothetical protein O181_067929 [Austropuccinia psidii MF-1]|uniref:Integrase zinc-binding domain-containing protein n=1 Tax=Austropuccinia psidii MF-1 TaxID=1389203 RepID=A0A9Q3EWB9_9BASI|nr:hypothetical protein [Austropuccinia psidii MF-1]
MTIVHKAGNIHKNSNGFSRFKLPNTPYNPACVPANAETQIPIEGIDITDVGTEFFKEVRESYKHDKNSHILTSLLEKYFKDTDFPNSLDDIWKTSYDNGRFHLFNGILYHRVHDKIHSLNLSEDRTMERISTCAWWPCWRKDVIEYCHSCDRCQKANKATGKSSCLMINIQEPSTPWEVVHMDWVTTLPPGGEISYNSCLVTIDRYRKTPIFLPFHNDDTAMDTALLIWNKVISHTGLFKNIIRNRDPRFSSDLWAN